MVIVKLITSPTTALVTLAALETINLTLGSTVTLSLVLLTTVLLSELLAKTVLDKLPAVITLTIKVTVADLPGTGIYLVYFDRWADTLQLIGNL